MDVDYSYLDDYTCDDYPRCWHTRKPLEMCPSCVNHYWQCKELGFDIQRYFDDSIDPFELYSRRMKSKVPKTNLVMPAIDAPANYSSAYELTLTTPKDDPYELINFLDKLVKSALYRVLSCSACIELTQAGLPHIHAIIYSSKKYCDASKVPKLGFTHRFSMNRVRDLDAYRNYILKGKDDPNIIAYCAAKNIRQFWDGLYKKEDNKAPVQEAEDNGREGLPNGEGQ